MVTSTPSNDAAGGSTTGEGRERPRLLAVTASNAPVTLTYARLVDALRRAGAEVRTLPVPTAGPSDAEDDRPPRLSDLKAGLHALAESVTAAIRGGDTQDGPGSPWLVSLLRTLEGSFDAVVAVDPRVARLVFPAAGQVWPQAVRVAVDGDFHIEPEWQPVELDDLVTPHPSLGRELARIQQGHARLRTGGPIVAAGDAEARRLPGDGPMVVVSFARLGSGDVDPLLFQLSLAHPERFQLLLLPSGRAGIDELVRTRAAGYGLRGKRPRAGSGHLDAWVRGAAVLVGHPSPGEAAAAVCAGVPQLLVAPDARLEGGDSFLAQHGLAAHASSHLSVAVQLEALLPGGGSRDEALESLAGFESDGAAGAAAAVLDAVQAGRPAPGEVGPPADADGELEDIGASAVAPTAMNERVKRTYLKEIIIQLKLQDKQLARARVGLDRWQHRYRLARDVGDATLSHEARVRVDGLERIVARLQREVAQLAVLRERFSRKGEVRAADRETAARFMSAEAAAALDRMSAHGSAQDFAHLELDDALSRLKRRLDGDSSR